MEDSRIRKLCEGFSRLNRAEREQRLIEMGFLIPSDIPILREPHLLDERVEHFIENVIGLFPIPLGVAVNFVIDQRDVVIPMAIEETSIIAAASRTARWIAEQGELRTRMLGRLSIGQIHFPRIQDNRLFASLIEAHKIRLLERVNQDVLSGLVRRHGGARDLQSRSISRPDGSTMGVIHLLIDTCDAMGANLINQACEFLKPFLEEITHEKCGLCILSNLNDTKITRAEVVIRGIDPSLGEAMTEASLFAESDPYRAATSNKGVLNAMDAVLLATGNDWRAVEAGVHAYAARSGQYRSITSWAVREGDLHGEIEVPISVGIVGGVTRLHPTAEVCLKMLGVDSAEGLSKIVAAVGLVQNLGALRALCMEGIIQGHMRLHISNLALRAGARKEEMEKIRVILEKVLKIKKTITSGDVQTALMQVRIKQA